MGPFEVIQFLVKQHRSAVIARTLSGDLPLHLSHYKSFRRQYDLTTHTTSVRFLAREHLLIGQELVLDQDKDGMLASHSVLFEYFAELMIEQPHVVKRISLDCSLFSRDSWYTLSRGLRALAHLETLSLRFSPVLEDADEDEWISSCHDEIERFNLDEGLWNVILERNPNLKSLQLDNIVSNVSMKTVTALFEGIARGKLQHIDIDLGLTNDMIRGRPDLWIRDDDPVPAEVAEHHLFMKKLAQGMLELTTAQLDDLRKTRRAIVTANKRSYRSTRCVSTDEHGESKRLRHT